MNARPITDTQTDWTRLARRDDADIDYSDAPAILSEPQQARIRYPNGQTVPGHTATLEVDAEVLAWFKAHEGNYQATINQLLRNFMQQHEHDLAR